MSSICFCQFVRANGLETLLSKNARHIGCHRPRALMSDLAPSETFAFLLENFSPEKSNNAGSSLTSYRFYLPCHKLSLLLHYASLWQTHHFDKLDSGWWNNFLHSNIYAGHHTGLSHISYREHPETVACWVWNHALQWGLLSTTLTLLSQLKVQ